MIERFNQLIKKITNKDLEKITINAKLKELRYPLEIEPFPIYPHDRWRGIPDHQGNIIGGEYWGEPKDKAKGIKGVFESHSHPFEEHGHVFEGQLLLYVSGDQKPILVKQGESYIVQPNVYHEVHWLTKTTLILRWNPALKGFWTWDKVLKNGDPIEQMKALHEMEEQKEKQDNKKRLGVPNARKIESYSL